MVLVAKHIARVQTHCTIITPPTHQSKETLHQIDHNSIIHKIEDKANISGQMIDNCFACHIKLRYRQLQSGWVKWFIWKFGNDIQRLLGKAGNNYHLKHDDVIKWKHFPRHGPFVQRSVTRIFSLICAWIEGIENNREAGDLRRHRAHYDVIVMNFECNRQICRPWIRNNIPRSRYLCQCAKNRIFLYVRWNIYIYIYDRNNPTLQ